MLTAWCVQAEQEQLSQRLQAKETKIHQRQLKAQQRAARRASPQEEDNDHDDADDDESDADSVSSDDSDVKQAMEPIFSWRSVEEVRQSTALRLRGAAGVDARQSNAMGRVLVTTISAMTGLLQLLHWFFRQSLRRIVGMVIRPNRRRNANTTN
jgi:hypothetical protein